MSSVITKQHTIAEDRKRFIALASYEILDTPAEPVFDAIAELAAAVCNVPIAAIGLLGEERQWLKAACGLGDMREISADASFCHRAMEGITDLLVINDLRKHPRFAAHPMVIGPFRLRFYAGIPLITPEGHRIGSLCVIDQQRRILTGLQRITLKQLARVVMHLLEARKAELYAIRLGRLLERSDDGICVLDAATLGLEYANENAQTYLGCSMSELRHLTLKDLLPADQFAKFKAAIQPLYFNEKTTADIETTGLRKDGTMFPIEVRVQIWREGGKQAKLCAAFKDITRRKQAELEQALLASIVLHSDDAIISTTLDGIVTSWNRGAEKLFGFTKTETIGQKIWLLVPKDEIGQVSRFFDSLIETGCAQRYETQHQCKHGRLIDVAITVSPITDESGAMIGISKVVRDITKQKEAERILHDSHQNLEAKVIKTEEKLQGSKEEAQEYNAALNVLLRRRESDKSGAKAALTRDLEDTIFPFLKRLRRSVVNQHQVRLLEVLEGNLGSLAQTYGRANSLSVAYKRLSRVEVQVASMVRLGLPTKVIADNLKISIGTVSCHRKNIRKKLIAGDLKINLSNFLKSLSEDN